MSQAPGFLPLTGKLRLPFRFADLACASPGCNNYLRTELAHIRSVDFSFCLFHNFFLSFSNEMKNKEEKSLQERKQNANIFMNEDAEILNKMLAN